MELKGFTEDKGFASWQIVDEEIYVNRNILHSNDYADGNNTYYRSWQKFYAAGYLFGKQPLYNGSSYLFKDAFPALGGVAKVTIYLRHSQGFLHWLTSFEMITASEIAVCNTLKNQGDNFEQTMVMAKKISPLCWQ